MAFSVSALQSFGPHRITGAWEYLLLPGDPGVTYTRGQRCIMTNGVLVVATGETLVAPFVVQETVVCPAATQAFPVPREMNAFRTGLSDASKCLVRVGLQLTAGTPVHIGKIANFDDITVSSYVASTRTVTISAATGGNDYHNGALVYVYEGAAAGELNVVEDYADATPALVMHRAFKTAVDSTSRLLVLSGEAVASRGITLLGRCGLKDADELDMAQGSDDGSETILAGWRDIEQYISKGHLPTVTSRAIWAS